MPIQNDSNSSVYSLLRGCGFDPNEIPNYYNSNTSWYLCGDIIIAQHQLDYARRKGTNNVSLSHTVTLPDNTVNNLISHGILQVVDLPTGSHFLDGSL